MQSITTFKGVNYGVMNGTDVRGIWYNKHVFAKAGIPTPWQPRNWADILSAARTIKAKVPGVVPMNLYSGIPMDEASSMQGFEMLLYGTHDPLYDYTTNKWVASSKGFQDALSFVQTVYNPKALLGPTDDIALSGLAWSPIQLQMLPKDKLGIDIDGSWVPGAWASTGAAPWPQWQSVMGMAKMPTEFGQAPYFVTLSGGWAYSITAKSPNHDAAWKVIQAANSAQNLALFDVLVGNIGVRKDESTIPSYHPPDEPVLHQPGGLHPIPARLPGLSEDLQPDRPGDGERDDRHEPQGCHVELRLGGARHRRLGQRGSALIGSLTEDR